MNRIIKYVALDILKNKTLIIYTILLSLLSWSVLFLEDNESKGILTLLNVVLLSVPLVAIVFASIYIYNSSEFIELLICQPIKRSKIYLSIYCGLTFSLILAFLIGCGIPVALLSPTPTGWILVVSGSFISAVFVSLAFLSSSFARDKARGLGIAILLWMYFAILFDGLILFLMFQFSDYPIEKLMVGLTTLSPVDICRIMVLLQLDVSAMMGYTGAIFKDFFGTGIGQMATLLLLVLWIIIPYLIALRKFIKKDI